MTGWATVADLYRFVSSADARFVHVGVGSRVYGARTGKDMGGRTNYRTLCSGKQLGGPWGYSASADLDGALCARCSRLARVAS